MTGVLQPASRIPITVAICGNEGDDWAIEVYDLVVTRLALPASPATSKGVLSDHRRFRLCPSGI